MTSARVSQSIIGMTSKLVNLHVKHSDGQFCRNKTRRILIKGSTNHDTEAYGGVWGRGVAGCRGCKGGMEGWGGARGV